jgi:predicted nucleotidyltransferase
MKRDEALKQLQAHMPEMVARFGVKRLALFGSTARDEAREDSDVDVLVDLEKPTFRAYMGLKFFLEDHMHVTVDVVMRDSVRAPLKPYIEREALDVA